MKSHLPRQGQKKFNPMSPQSVGTTTGGRDGAYKDAFVEATVTFSIYSFFLSSLERTMSKNLYTTVKF
jgi:hypothetical protein